MIFYSSKITSGYSWTITTKLGHILYVAESQYGERDKSYTILGVELYEGEQPCIWYPGNCNNIAIRITSNCSDNMDRAVFQVAHEAIHCLSPTGLKNSNFLEEGLASHFSIQYTRDNGHGVWSYNEEKYARALGLFEELITVDRDIINKLRQREPTLSLITKEILIEVNCNIPEILAEELTKKFDA